MLLLAHHGSSGTAVLVGISAFLVLVAIVFAVIRVQLRNRLKQASSPVRVGLRHCASRLSDVGEETVSGTTARIDGRLHGANAWISTTQTSYCDQCAAAGMNADHGTSRVGIDL